MRSLLDSETGREGGGHENQTGSLVQSSNLARETRFGISMTPDSVPISPRCTDSPQSEAHTASKELPQAMEVTPMHVSNTRFDQSFEG